MELYCVYVGLNHNAMPCYATLYDQDGQHAFHIDSIWPVLMSLPQAEYLLSLVKMNLVVAAYLSVHEPEIRAAGLFCRIEAHSPWYEAGSLPEFYGYVCRGESKEWDITDDSDAAYYFTDQKTIDTMKKFFAGNGEDLSFCKMY